MTAFFLHIRFSRSVGDIPTPLSEMHFLFSVYLIFIQMMIRLQSMRAFNNFPITSQIFPPNIAEDMFLY